MVISAIRCEMEAGGTEHVVGRVIKKGSVEGPRLNGWLVASTVVTTARHSERLATGTALLTRQQDTPKHSNQVYWLWARPTS